MRTRLLLSVVLTMLSVNAQAADSKKPAEQYICTAEHAVGFRYDKSAKEWEGTKFQAQQKYLIATSKGDKVAYQITEVGGTKPIGSCKIGFKPSGYLVCDVPFAGKFRYNKNNGRFMRVEPFGYIDVGSDSIAKSDEETDTPFMEIGKCVEVVGE